MIFVVFCGLTLSLVLYGLFRLLLLACRKVWSPSVAFKWWAGVGILLGPTLVLAALFFRATHPEEEFFREEYKNAFGVNGWPAGAEIDRRVAAYPDLQGDYGTAALVTMNCVAYDHLMRSTATSPEYKAADLINTEEVREILAEIPVDSIRTGVARVKPSGRQVYTYLGFIPSRCAVLVHTETR